MKGRPRGRSLHSWYMILLLHSAPQNGTVKIEFLCRISLPLILGLGPSNRLFFYTDHETVKIGIRPWK